MPEELGSIPCTDDLFIGLPVDWAITEQLVRKDI